MPRCTGECKKQEFETRRWRNPTVTADDEDCPRLTRQQVEQIIADAKRELEEDEMLQACEGENCDCSYVESDWGNWVDGHLTKETTVGDCTYTVEADYQIRSRILNGGCVTTQYSAAALGILPGTGIAVSVADKGILSPEKLKKIGEILS